MGNFIFCISGGRSSWSCTTSISPGSKTTSWTGISSNIPKIIWTSSFQNSIPGISWRSIISSNWISRTGKSSYSTSLTISTGWTRISSRGISTRSTSLTILIFSITSGLIGISLTWIPSVTNWTNIILIPRNISKSIIYSKIPLGQHLDLTQIIWEQTLRVITGMDRGTGPAPLPRSERSHLLLSLHAFALTKLKSFQHSLLLCLRSAYSTLSNKLFGDLKTAPN